MNFNPIIASEYLVFISITILLLTAYLGWKSTNGKGRGLRVACTLLRVFGAACICLIAFNPGYWKKENIENRREWALLLDRSASMAVKDSKGKISRFDSAVKSAREIIKKYPEEKVNIYTFASSIDDSRPDTESLTKVKPDGNATDINKSCMMVIDRFSGGAKKLSGIILLSDGKQTGTSLREKTVMAARARNAGIYSLAFGNEVAERDLELLLPKKNFIAFAKQSINIPVQVINRGLGNIEVSVKVSDPGGKIILSRKLRMEDNAKVKLELKIETKELGFQEFTVEVAGDFSERVKWNNSSRIGVTVMKDKLKVLYLEGQPFWDSKFLAQLLREDKNINLTTVYRIAAGRFVSVSSGNAEKSITEDRIFPASVKELSKYNVVFIGHGAEYFLNPRRINMLHKYLADFGGALVFARAKPYTGEFSQLSLLESVNWGKSISGNFRWQPSAYGISTGFFGNMQFDENSKIWRELPTLKKITLCRSVKNFSEVLLYAETRRNSKDYKIPVLISRKHGMGIVLTVNAEGMWQWGFFPESRKIGVFYRRFWGQVVQQLIKYSEFLPGMDVSMRLDKTVVMPDTPVMAMINCRKPESTVNDIQLKLYRDRKLIQEFTAIRNSGKNSGWNALIRADNPGIYELKMICRYKKPAGKISSLRSILYVKRPPGETDDLSADAENLRQLSEDTGGVMLKNLEDVKNVFERHKAADQEFIRKSIWSPTWCSWLLLCLMLAMFAMEYFLRRRNGLL